MALQKEILLIPKLANVKIDTTSIKKELLLLQRDINKNMPLNLSLAADVSQSVGRIKSDLTKLIKPQLDNVLKLSIGAESISASKSTNTSGTRTSNTKEITAEALAIQKLKKDYNELIELQKQKNTLEKNIAGANVATQGAQIAEWNRQLDVLLPKYNALNALIESNPLNKQESTAKELSRLTTEREKGETAVANAIARQADAAKKVNDAQSTQIQKTTQDYKNLLYRMDKMKVNWSAFQVNPNLLASWNSLRDKIVEANKANDPKQYQLLNKEVAGFAGRINSLGAAHQSFADMVTNTFKRLGSYMSSMLVYRAIWGNLREGYQAVKDVDAAMSELKMITAASDKAYNDFFDNAADKAGKLGVAINELC